MAKRKKYQHSDDTLAELPVDYSFRREQAPEEELAPPPLPEQEPLEVPGEALDMDPLPEEDEYLDEIEEFLMEEMVERQAQERIDRMAEKIRVHVTVDFDSLDQEEAKETAPLWEEPEDLIRPDIQLEEEKIPQPQDYRPLWLYWATGVTAALVILALIYLLSF